MDQQPGSVQVDRATPEPGTQDPHLDDVRIVRGPRGLRADPFGYIPSLDGLRALALIGILFYHARFTWARGAFLAISVFFTLSGFLITSIVLRQWVASSGIGIREFWIRRFRRLLPAAWTTMALILAAGLAGAWNPDQLRSLRGDVPFGLAEIINWHFIFADRSYGADFTAPSPMEHFWSLAVEEQFYFFLPLVAALVLTAGASRRPTRRRLGSFATTLAVIAALSAVLNGLLARGSIDRAYFGTDTRMAEILVGGLLAVAMLRRLKLRGPGPRIASEVLGLVALGVMLTMWRLVSLRDQSLYPLGFVLSSATTVAVIVAALQEGVVTRILSFPPLVWLGKISYGMYLLHWPVFLVLSPVRTGLGQVPLFLVRVAVTTALATIMYNLIESPIRYRRVFPRRGFAIYSAVSVVVVVALLALATTDVPGPSEIDRAFRAPSTTTTVPLPHLQVLVLGDQAADDLAGLLGDRPDMTVTSASIPDCGLAIGGWIQMDDGSVERDVSRCRRSLETWSDAITERQPDFVLVGATRRDSLPRRFESDPGWSVAGDEKFENYLSGMFLDALETISTAAEPVGAQVIVTSIPSGEYPAPEPAPPRAPGQTPQQEKALAELDRELEQGLPDTAGPEERTRRQLATTSILAATAEVAGVRFLDIVAEADRLAGGPFDFDQPTPEDGPGIGPELAEWLEDELREAREAPPVVAPPPLDANSVTIPDPPAPRPRRHVAPGQRPTFLVAGDSVAMSVTFGLGHWASSSGAKIYNATRLGCPIARGGVTKVQMDTKEYGENCDWSDEFTNAVAAFRPNVVMLMSGVWEVTDRRLPGDNRFRHLGDPLMDRYVLAEFLSAVDLLGSDGASVALILQPHIESGRDKGLAGLPESDPARMDRLNEILEQVAEMRPDVVTLVDIREWMATQPGGEDGAELRPDGVHFDDDSSKRLASWLGPRLTDIAEGN